MDHNYQPHTLAHLRVLPSGRVVVVKASGPCKECSAPRSSHDAESVAWLVSGIEALTDFAVAKSLV
jgi:hypothetical protein